MRHRKSRNRPILSPGTVNFIATVTYVVGNIFILQRMYLVMIETVNPICWGIATTCFSIYLVLVIWVFIQTYQGGRN
jgi:hypothetical protein